MQIQAGIFGSLFPAFQITSQDAVAETPLVLPNQRGLWHHTGIQTLQTPPPSGDGASHVHVSATLRVYVSIYVSISKYCCSFPFYLIFFIIFLLFFFDLCYTFFISYHFSFLRLFLFLLLYIVIVNIFTHKYIVYLISFFDHQIIVYLKSVLLWSVYFLFEFYQYVEVKVFQQNISYLIYNRWYFPLNSFIEYHLSIIRSFRQFFLIYSMNLTFQSLYYKETITYTFHTF